MFALVFAYLVRFLAVSLQSVETGLGHITPAMDEAGLSIALMEALSDYGTVQYFGVATFTTGIFRTWFGLGDSAAAAQLSVVLLAFVAILLIVERRSRSRARYHHVGSRSRPLVPYSLDGWRGWGAAAWCLLPLGLGFVLPGGQLLVWSARTAERMVDDTFWQLTLNTIGIAVTTAILAVALALFLAYGLRLKPNFLVRIAVRWAGMGYAVPGIVVAVAIWVSPASKLPTVVPSSA